MVQDPSQTDRWRSGVNIGLAATLTRHELEPNEDLVAEMPRKSVIACSTFYKPKEGVWNPIVQMRAQLALDMVKLATEAGYQVVCVDETSEPGWRQEATTRGARLVDPDFTTYSAGAHNMGRCRRQAVDLASQVDGRPIVVYMEPEKAPAIRAADGSLPLAHAATPLAEDKADWIIPRRRDNGGSYPGTQQCIERAGNLAAQSLLRAYSQLRGMTGEEVEIFSQYLDHFNGPKMFHRDRDPLSFKEYSDIAALTTEPRFNDMWGSVHFPPMLALMRGSRVRGVAIDYVHPLQQTKLEGSSLSTDLKRGTQYSELSTGTAHLLNRDLKARGLPLIAI